ncbi:L,D-peptidoglycan transpeptidase YkuD (ErfK/YbiS/YcfS/YnhG family) [Breoghania corrubedonensis]|uniref:L,D-peptidoglycan transpeptidase YkuD (ErfK/YbiS/YcfS/YnhG family) n=1 Tax=Breoghania corrubedonensis TaxID=665038 RepID=A0A2T5VHV1_9HYPH|nr:L,D-transpeptidase family protein [Breoghania corrubedonensis]PTW63333.1 L,D-peptidoglycan transpeptidase YkuD (ErfK/YbiS/YcfS/YnhG family) [Breoghania corrubedonensis]
MAETERFSMRSEIRVRSLAAPATRGRLTFGALTVACALGRAGISYNKREGDGLTPAGCYRLIEVRYRADRVARPATRLPVRIIRPDDGWCDDPGDGRYNRAIRLPCPASHERLWREDHLYDLLVILDHNRHPRIRGRGSAVFFHLARPGYRPTEGCVAVALDHMRRVLALSCPSTMMRIG